MKQSNRLTDEEDEKLSLEYELNPPALSGNPGFLTKLRERALVSELLSPTFARIVNIQAEALSLSPSEVIQYALESQLAGNS